jgi:acetoin utilization deacetylase AcuC-like enzyme
MLIVYSPHQPDHRPGSFRAAGSPRTHPDIPERLDALLSGVDESRRAIVEPRDHGERYVRLVHTERYIEFLRDAHATGKRLPAASEAVTPNVHPRRMTKENYPTSIVGRAGWQSRGVSVGFRDPSFGEVE